MALKALRMGIKLEQPMQGHGREIRQLDQPLGGASGRCACQEGQLLLGSGCPTARQKKDLPVPGPPVTRVRGWRTGGTQRGSLLRV